MRARLCSGRLLRRALLAVALLTAVAGAQTAPKADAKKASAHRANELMLAKLRPGHATTTQALAIYRQWPFGHEEHETQMTWRYTCYPGEVLTLDYDENRIIQVIRLGETGNFAICDSDGRKELKSGWRTGKGLRVGDRAAKVAELYGNPDSRSPSTKGGQPLELWYYAFDWAGADVPQVMEVLCTREADGKPGRVVEITLAGPSL
jgi:hypothetical protein